MSIRFSFTVALVALAVSTVSADVNVNFASMFAQKPANYQPATGDNHADVNLNFAYMMDGYQCNGKDDSLDCSKKDSLNFTMMGKDPYVATMTGLCRYTAEPGHQVACVRPGGTVDVQITLKNTGSQIWPRQNVKLQFDEGSVNYTYWNKATLYLNEDVAPTHNGIFRGVVAAPAHPGVYDLVWFIETSCGRIGNITARVEVTCSDQIFCNGMERWVNGKCMQAAHPQCDDLEPCTQDTCIEETQVCIRKVIDNLCPKCNAGNCTASCRPGQECGSDGCGGVCGGFCDWNKACHDGMCVIPSAPGTCGQPYDLIENGKPLIGRHVLVVDNSLGVDEVTPTCNTDSTATEIVFKFVIPKTDVPISIDARLSGVDEIDLDTLLEIRKDRCQDKAPGDEDWHSEAFDPKRNVWCSDDATPPAHTGSRVASELLPGTYYLVVDGYSTSTVGKVKVDVRFTSGYTPKCLSKFCGPDGGGGDCGPCEEGFTCSDTLTCIPEPCTVERCLNGTAICGDDGCGRGGKCGPLNGACPLAADGSKQYCIQPLGICKSFPVCDHLRPIPFTPCQPNEYVGDDCLCHSMNKELPDLRIDYERSAGSMYIDYIEFDEASCAWKEKCVDGTGMRRVLRFDTVVVNQGNANLEIAPPPMNPQEFEFSACHNHYHYKGFAEYRLLDKNMQTARRGHKQAYCLEDSGSHETQEGPSIACRPASDCVNPGLQRGFFDVYGADLDCQWIDITDLPAGDYHLRIDLNTFRQLHESNHENNYISIPVNIPPPETQKTARWP